MKKFIISIIGMILGQMWAFAAHVPVQKAQLVGGNFLSQQSSFNGVLPVELNLQLVYTEGVTDNQHKSGNEGITYFYVFNATGDGFVIVAGDDRVLPILGYSDKGNFGAENIPDNCKKWLENYKSQIRYVVENEILATEEIEQQWADFYNNVSQKTQKAAVSPLLSTTWDQSPYYNQLCPSNTVTGCVATAMAQVMKYWNYPTQGTGYHSYNHSTYGTLSANFASTTYNWSSMPNQLTSSSSSTQKTAVATLMYHCGVSVDMDYNTAANGGSGAYVIISTAHPQDNTEYALKTYFGYKNTLQGKTRSSYTDANWKTLLKTELNAGRPIIYAGFGTAGGHCFVCDGYNESDYFHFNWGWGGSSDGYFQINALNPGSLGTGGGAGGFNSGQQAIIGVEPASGGGNNNTTDIRLYSAITPTTLNVPFYSSFSITASIGNFGSTAFSGSFAAAIFDQNNTFIDFVETKSVSLSSSYYNTYTFSNSGTPALVPGTYTIVLFYKTSSGEWTQIGNGNYSNARIMTVYYYADIEVYSNFLISTGSTLTHGQSATISINFANTGSSTYVGKYGVALLDMEGKIKQTIAEVSTGSTGLASGKTYQNPVTFSTSNVSVEPGTYLLAALYYSGTSWYYAGSYYYQNPVYITVVAPSIVADQYETNNTVSQAYTFSNTFSGNAKTINTSGANFHTGTDIDYYKIVLPTGYNYTLTARLHDAYNSGDGQTYTVDALFSYSTNGGSTWSETYDDIMSGSIKLNGGGTIYFKVAPYFSGNTGTYSLNINITRASTNDIQLIENENVISLYPNPASSELKIKNYQLKDGENVEIIDILGRVQQSKIINQQSEIILDVSHLPKGMYFVRIGNWIGKFLRN
ncbi:MAG: thiol protease/hemagglutinin PrtT [Bacteroidales bacterium]|jgi:hypothetical protein|nr:thiol protease/hemagglutinin PrtT [Bacteroidales bacterium]